MTPTLSTLVCKCTGFMHIVKGLTMMYFQTALQVFSGISIDRQNEVLEHVYIKLSMQAGDLFPIDLEWHSAHLLSVLNRVTNDLSDIETVSFHLLQLQGYSALVCVHPSSILFGSFCFSFLTASCDYLI